MFGAESQPQVPRMGGFCCTAENDAGSERCLHSAIITRELISGDRSHPVQGTG